jgi:hypothetical protein
MNDDEEPVAVQAGTAGDPWSPDALRAACQEIGRDKTGRVVQARVFGSRSEAPSNVRDLFGEARAIAGQYGLNVWLSIDNDVMSVTFARSRGRRGHAGTEWCTGKGPGERTR